MRYFFLVVAFLLLKNIANSQTNNENILTLQQEILHSKNDSASIVLLDKLSIKYIYADSIDAAITAAIRAKKIAQKINYQKGLAIAISQIGFVYEINNKDYVPAITYYQQAQKIAEENHFTELIYQNYARLLNLYFYLDDLPDAMLITTKGLQLAAVLNDKVLEAKYTGLAGFIYLKERDSDRTQEYYQKYLNTASTLKDSDMVADAHNCLADAYSLTKNYKLALKELFISLKIYKHFNNKERIAYTYSKIGTIYQLQNKNEEAKTFLLNTFMYLKNVSPNEYDLAHYYLIIGNIYTNLSEFKQADNNLHSGLAIAEQIYHRENIKDGYQYLSAMFAKQKQYDSAYYYNVLYNNLKDSVINENESKEVEIIHTRFDVGEKNKEITLLNQLQQIQQLKIRNQNTQRNIIITVFVLIIIISILVYNRRQLKERTNFQKKLNIQQKEMFNSIMIARDKERKRIAEDIHDSIGSILSAAKLQLSELEESKNLFTQEQSKKYNQSLLLIDDAAQELRNISHSLLPATLSKIGLIAALQNLFDKISSTQKLSIELITDGFTTRLKEGIEISVYYIILEIINNTIIHAKATKATVQLIKYPTYVNIVVEDNGIGFNYNSVMGSNTSGIGLKNIISRVEYLKGNVHVESNEGKGASVLIDIPI